MLLKSGMTTAGCVYTTKSLLHCLAFQLCNSCGLPKKLEQLVRFRDCSYGRSSGRQYISKGITLSLFAVMSCMYSGTC